MSKHNRPSVLLIYTGGTIGMVENQETGALEAFNFSKLIENVPELKRFNYNIDSYQFTPPIDSSDMEPSLWSKLVKIVYENYANYDGFVILHGTDTMAYTASALSFMLEDLSKPVILTGSQLPIGKLRTDGKENLITAVEIAAAKNPDEQPSYPKCASSSRTTSFAAIVPPKSMRKTSMPSARTTTRLWQQPASTSNMNMTRFIKPTRPCL